MYRTLFGKVRGRVFLDRSMMIRLAGQLLILGIAVALWQEGAAQNGKLMNEYVPYVKR